MERSSAVEHLVEIAEDSSAMLRFREREIGWPLEELWATGELLSDASDLEGGAVVLVLDEPAEEVPWLALTPASAFVGDRLRLAKRPLAWSCRPTAWPAWNHENRRLVRYWSAADGLDDPVVEALRTGDVAGLPVVEPEPGELAAQLRKELDVSRRHLDATLDSYWDGDWRREHKGFAVGPEDHLWRAAQAVREISDALDRLEPGA
ncbi:MAG TPA: hypothetical protein VIL48_20370 [Acidimicrobiales bacterium]